MAIFNSYVKLPEGNWLLGGGPTPLKNDGVRQIGSSSQLLGKRKFMFQTTDQPGYPLVNVYITMENHHL